MVYRSIKRRVRQRSLACPFNRLANELLLDILDHLSLRDVQNARLTCRHLTIAGNTILRDRLTILYLHPSTRGLRQAVEICAHPVFNQAITEVVVLGLPPDLGCKWAPSMPRWPWSFPKPPRASGTSRIIWQEVAKESDIRTNNLLVKALLRLPNLVRLTYSWEVERPGLNPPPSMTNEICPREKIVTGDSQVLPYIAGPSMTDQSAASPMPDRALRLHVSDRGAKSRNLHCLDTSDLSILIALLKDCRLLREFSYEPIDRSPPIPLDRWLTLSGSQTLEIFKSLTTITFAFGSSTSFEHAGTMASGWTHSCKGVLEAANCLRSLHIVIWSETDEGCYPKGSSQESLISNVLCGLGSRPLTELTIVTKVPFCGSFISRSCY